MREALARHTPVFCCHSAINPLLERMESRFACVIHDSKMTDKKHTKPVTVLAR